MYAWTAANSYVLREAEKLARDACNLDSVTSVQELLAMAAQPMNMINVEQVMRDSLTAAVQNRSLLVVAHLLAHGADIHDVVPRNLMLEGKYGQSTKFSEPPIELLDLILKHGWDINSPGLPQHNMSPLLWYVLGSHKLVDWCLCHGAKLTVPGEITSNRPDDDSADIFYTPRHPLLLEQAACLSGVATFELLRARGAPLTPGKNWPCWSAPRVLIQAVKKAAHSTPVLGSDPVIGYTQAILMVKHLLHTVGLSPDGSGPCDSRPTIIMPDSPRGRYHTIGNRDKGESRDLCELVGLLLDAGADFHIVEENASSTYWQDVSTPLGYLKREFSVPFQRALEDWKRKQLHDNEYRGADPSAIKAENISLSFSKSGVGQLDKIPTEVISLISSYLSLVDVKSIRAVNRSMSAASFTTFTSYIGPRHLTFTNEAMEAFREQLESNYRLSRLCREIVFVKAEKVDDDRHAMSPSQDILTRCFEAAKTKGSLCSVVLQRGTQKELSCVLYAVEESGLVLNKLSLFPEGGSNCIAVSQYYHLVRILSFTTGTLQHFTWWTTPDSGQLTNMTSSQIITTLTQILSGAPNLQTLELGWYRTPPPKAEAFFLDSCSDVLLAMTKLRKLTLRGISISEVTLHQFLSRTNATRIKLQFLTLREGGTLRPILDVLTSGRFSFFHLDDLHETRGGSWRLAHFDIPGSKKYPNTDDVGPSELIREGRETRQKLEYRFSCAMPMGSRDMHQHFSQIRRLYGYD